MKEHDKDSLVSKSTCTGCLYIHGDDFTALEECFKGHKAVFTATQEDIEKSLKSALSQRKE